MDFTQIIQELNSNHPLSGKPASIYEQICRMLDAESSSYVATTLLALDSSNISFQNQINSDASAVAVAAALARSPNVRRINIGALMLHVAHRSTIFNVG